MTHLTLHKEVVWLDVSMNEVFAVNKFNAWNELIGQQEDSLKAESSGAKVEQVFKWRAQQFHDHHIEISLWAAPFDGGDAHATLHDAIKLGLYVKLRMLGFDTFQLDSHYKKRMTSVLKVIPAEWESRSLLPSSNVEMFVPR